MDVVRRETADMTQKVQNELIDIDGIKKYISSVGIKFDSANNEGSQIETGKAREELEPMFNMEVKSVLTKKIPWLEVEILPPQDIAKIMDLISRLESLPEVKTTDLLVETPNPIIRIFLNEPSPLAELLITIPQIEEVTEMFDASKIGVRQGERKWGRIQVMLGK